MKPNRDFWHNLEQRFRADQLNELRADYTYYPSLGKHWELVGPGSLVRERFVIGARLAGAAVGDLAASEQSLHQWLDYLSLKPGWLELQAPAIAELSDGSQETLIIGSIYRVIEKSAVMCLELEAAAELAQPIAPGQQASPALEPDAPAVSLEAPITPQDSTSPDPEPVAPSVSQAASSEGKRSVLVGNIGNELGRNDEVQRLFRKEGDFWKVVFDGKTILVKESKGMRYLRYLLNTGGRESSAFELFTAASGQPGAEVISSAGDLLDKRALADYKARRDDLKMEICDAERDNDFARKEILRSKLEALEDQLTSATGLGGRPRLVGDKAERARKAVALAINRAISALRKHDSALAGHLDSHVERGQFLRYRSDGVPWNF